MRRFRLNVIVCYLDIYEASQNSGGQNGKDVPQGFLTKAKESSFSCNTE